MRIWLSQAHPLRNDYPALVEAGAKDGDWCVIKQYDQSPKTKILRVLGDKAYFSPCQIIQHDKNKSYVCSGLVFDRREKRWDNARFSVHIELRGTGKRVGEIWRAEGSRTTHWLCLEKSSIARSSIQVPDCDQPIWVFTPRIVEGGELKTLLKEIERSFD